MIVALGVELVSANVMKRPKRVWLTFVIITVVVLGADIAYLEWRGHSLEPLSTRVDLTRPGRYTIDASGFHTSQYHPEFRLQLPFKTDVFNWFPDQTYEQLWGASPPEVHIRVFDRRGRVVFEEQGPLTRANGWTVTGAIGQTEVELYKWTQFTGEMFGSYRTDLIVLRGSPLAVTYQPAFELATVKSYALLGPTFVFMGLAAASVIAALVIALLQWSSATADRR